MINISFDISGKIDHIKGSSPIGNEFEDTLSLVEKLRQGFVEATENS